MKVLHVYSHDNPRLAMYVSLLSQAMPADVECVYVDNAPDMRRAVKDFRPDITHQHGRFHVATGAAPTPPSRLIVSPHGEEVDVHHAYTVIARSPYELTTLQTERKELVRNPLITRAITFQEAAGAIAGIYRRVMDSNPLELMDAATRHFLAVALKAGLLGDKGWVSDDSQWNGSTDAVADSSLHTLHSPLLDFHHLYIYAELEGVMDIVHDGIETLGITDAVADSAFSPLHSSSRSADCYLPHGYEIPKAMPGASITDLLHDIEQNGITLLRLTELTRALYDDNLDEKALMEQAETEKLRPILQSVLQVLSEQTLLTEGFMPCPPTDNSDTQRLRTQLENHLKL